jgi:hypothetical protein
LLQHIWTLWEILVTGQDIVIVAPTAAQCSEIVLGLASLLVPVASVGDFRPYISADDSDVLVLAATAQLKCGELDGAGLEENIGRVMSRTRSMIVGVTDPSILSKLEDFAVALFVYPPAEEAAYLADSDAVYKGLRTRNTAELFSIKDTSSQQKKGSTAKKRSDADSFSNMFQTWLEKGTRKSALACRREPSNLARSKLLVRIKKLHPDDRCVLGDQMLRDHLKSLTSAYFSPVTSLPGSMQPGCKVDLSRERKEYEAEKLRLTQLQSADEKGMFYLGLDELKIWFANAHMWFGDSMPYMLMWSCIMLTYYILYFIGVPIFFIMLGAFLIKVPDRVPPRFEDTLQLVLPETFLYPNKR